MHLNSIKSTYKLSSIIAGTAGMSTVARVRRIQCRSRLIRSPFEFVTIATFCFSLVWANLTFFSYSFIHLKFSPFSSSICRKLKTYLFFTLFYLILKQSNGIVPQSSVSFKNFSCSSLFKSLWNSTRLLRMTDALSLIRDYTLQKKEIETKDGLVYLGDFVWDVKVPVNPLNRELNSFRQKRITQFGDPVVMDKQKNTTQSKQFSSFSRT